MIIAPSVTARLPALTNVLTQSAHRVTRSHAAAAYAAAPNVVSCGKANSGVSDELAQLHASLHPVPTQFIATAYTLHLLYKFDTHKPLLKADIF